MPTNNTFVMVGSSSTLISAERPQRLGTVYSNDSTQTIYLSIGGAAAVVGSGNRLAPGESLVIEPDDRLNGQVNGICASGGANLCVFETYN